MAEITNVSKLIINYLTEAQYQTAKASGLINENELYVTDVQDSTTLDCFEELFTATGGQTLFTLTEGTYVPNQSRLTICVNGAQQPSTAYTETSSSSFTFDSGLSAGDSVIARYVNARIVSNINLEPHKTTHYSGGTDPLTPSDIGAASSTHTHTKVDTTDFAHKSTHATGGSDPLTAADIGAATAGANSNITSLSGLMTALSITQGGTGATTASAALAALGGSKIATGSYTGTGTYGGGSQNRLTFSFIPKLVVVQQSDASLNTVLTYNSPYGLLLYSNVVAYDNVVWDGNTVSWYAGNAPYQLNSSGKNYYYVAIG